MEKIHIRNLFKIWIPLSVNLDSAVAVQRIEPFGVDIAGQFNLNIKLVGTDCFGNIKYEPKNCFTWAKHNPISFQQNHCEEIGILLRLKINEGVFDFRRMKDRIFQLTVDYVQSGSVMKTGASRLWELFPKRRHLDSLEDNENEIVVPMYWLGENGYLIDAKHSNESPSSHLSLFDSSQPESSELEIAEPEIPIETTLYGEEMLGESPEMQCEQSTQLVSNLEYARSSDNYMVLYNGNAEVVGNFRALNFYKASDINIKEDIRLLDQNHDCRSTLLRINGVSYKFKKGVSDVTNRRFIGYIAQQIESVVPEAVQLIDGILHVDYESLIPYLSESIKQNYSDIQEISSEVRNIKHVIDTMHAQFTGIKQQPCQEKRRTKKQNTKQLGWAGLIAFAAIIAIGIGAMFFTDQPQTSPPLKPLVRANYERKILVDLYAAFVPIQPHRPTWNLSTPHCTWMGVTCDTETGRVTALKIPSFATATSGNATAIPATISNLTELQYLDLSDDFLASTIPESIKLLHHLVELNLTHNHLVGTVPDLRGLTKLRRVYLSHNRLTGSLDTLLQLQSLEALFMQHNPINAELPRDIAPSRSLSEINLANCGLFGVIPQSWSAVNFTQIDMNSNQLNGSVPCFGPSLVNLNLDTNDLNGEFCGSSLQSIRSLYLRNNRLIGAFDLPLANVSRMQHLFISNNRFTSFMPSSSDRTIPPPSQCDAKRNAFKCPIPNWTQLSCAASCS